MFDFRLLKARKSLIHDLSLLYNKISHVKEIFLMQFEYTKFHIFTFM